MTVLEYLNSHINDYQAEFPKRSGVHGFLYMLRAEIEGDNHGDEIRKCPLNSVVGRQCMNIIHAACDLAEELDIGDDRVKGQLVKLAYGEGMAIAMWG